MCTPRASAKDRDGFIENSKRRYETIKKYLKWSSEPESILDIGIGNGLFTKEVVIPLIPQNIKEYVGCDKFESTLNSADEANVHEKFKTLEIDITSQNIPENVRNKFQHIFVNNIFHHMRNLRQVLMNIKIMLKPGGQFAFVAYQKCFNDEAYDKLDKGKWSKYNNRRGLSPFYNSVDAVKEYKNLIRSVGFVDCHIFTEHYKPQMPEEFLEEICTYVNYSVPYVEEEDKEEYLKDFKEAVKKSTIMTIIKDEKTGNRIFEFNNDIIYGVVSKPL